MKIMQCAAMLPTHVEQAHTKRCVHGIGVAFVRAKVGHVPRTATCCSFRVCMIAMTGYQRASTQTRRMTTASGGKRRESAYAW